MKSAERELARLLGDIQACRVCIDTPRGRPLPHEPRPVLRPSSTAKLCICSQAPGVRVHASGKPFTDPSGDRLRAWLNLTPDEFYDQRRVAIVPMGFCFPGHDAAGGDLPPRASARRRGTEAVRRDAATRADPCWSAAMPSAGTSAEEGKGDMSATVKDWRTLLNAPRPRAACRCRIPPGATTPGSTPIHGSSANCCRGYAVRSETALSGCRQ